MGSRQVYGEEERLLPWALERIGLTAFRSDARTIGRERDGEIVAVIVYDNFSSCDCNMHVASDGSGNWLTRELLVHAFAFPFIQCGFRRVTGMVPARNARALAFDENLGFVREGYHPHASDDDDLITLGLLRERCRFIPKENRKV